MMTAQGSLPEFHPVLDDALFEEFRFADCPLQAISGLTTIVVRALDEPHLEWVFHLDVLVARRVGTYYEARLLRRVVPICATSHDW